MTHIEFLNWLRDLLAFTPLDGKTTELRMIDDALRTVEPFVPGYSFCGGTWDSSKFDYYWTPNPQPGSEGGHDDAA